MTIQEIITLAEGHLDRDVSMAVYILRDRPEIEAAGLADLAWGLHRDGAHKNDVLGLIEQLRRYIEYTEGGR